MGAKCLLQKMIITPLVGLGRIRELEGWCYNHERGSLSMLVGRFVILAYSEAIHYS